MAELLCVDVLMFSAAKEMTPTVATNIQLLGSEVQRKYANIPMSKLYKNFNVSCSAFAINVHYFNPLSSS
jgi:hypothetical protein